MPYLSMCCGAKGMQDANWCSGIYEVAVFMGIGCTRLPEKYSVIFCSLTAFSVPAGIVMALWVST